MVSIPLGTINTGNKDYKEQVEKHVSIPLGTINTTQYNIKNLIKSSFNSTRYN